MPNLPAVNTGPRDPRGLTVPPAGCTIWAYDQPRRRAGRRLTMDRMPTGRPERGEYADYAAADIALVTLRRIASGRALVS
jgi:hypothetical protein